MKFSYKCFYTKNGQPFKSKNLIPRDVRNLFRAKNKASKALKVVKSVKRCLALRKRIASLDFELKRSYENRKRKKESDIFERQKITLMFYLITLRIMK